MKVLHYSPYTSIDNIPAFCRNKTGFGYMVSDICTSLIRSNIEVGLLTYSGITPSFKYKNVRVVGKEWRDVFKSFNFISFTKYLLEAKEEIGDFSSKKELVLSALFKTHFIKEVTSYDIVHFHGVTPNNIYFINYCIKHGIKVIVTLHGLNSFNKNILYSSEKCRMEKKFINFSFSNRVPVIVISEGVRIDIINHLKLESSDNFKVVMNGCNLIEQFNKTLSLGLQDQYKISNIHKVAVCVGNFSKNKNQYQVVEAFLLLPDKVKKGLKILFLGEPTGDPRVQDLIEENNLCEHLIICGAIKKESMGSYYNIADFTVLASKYEGFGLSIIEGFSYGLPNLAFSDLGAINSLFDEVAMVKVNSRSTSSLTQGIKLMLTRNWNKEQIILHSKKFSLQEMANKYASLYKSILD